MFLAKSALTIRNKYENDIYKGLKANTQMGWLTYWVESFWNYKIGCVTLIRIYNMMK